MRIIAKFGNPLAILSRFWSKVEVSVNGSCWRWTGSVNAYGYAVFSILGRMYSAHRIMWILFHGSVPVGKEADHLCRNRACVNPSHLEMVTHRENVRRGMAPAAQAARRNCCAKGHQYTPINTHIRPDGARQCKICRRACDRRHALAVRTTRHVAMSAKGGLT